MIITSPEAPERGPLTPAERLEVACSLYSAGRIGKVGGAEAAGLDLFDFQRALSERGILQYSDEMLAEDMESLATLFPA